MFPTSSPHSTRKISPAHATEANLILERNEFNRRKEEYVDGNLRILFSIDCGSDVMCVQFSSDGGLIAAGLADGSVKIITSDVGTLVHHLTNDDVVRQCLPATSLIFQPFLRDDPIEHKHLLMATYASGLIRLWHFTSSKCLLVIEERKGATLSSALNPKALNFLTAGSNEYINQFDFETRQHIATFRPSDTRDSMKGHRSRVFAVRYHPIQEHVFASGGWDDTVQIWDDRMKHSVRYIYGPHICGEGLDIDKVHNHLLTASWRKENVLQIWDFDKGEKIKDVPQDSFNSSLLYCAQWIGNDYIASGGSDKNLFRIIDRGTLNTVGQLGNLAHGVYSIANDGQGPKSKIAIGSSTRIYVLKMEKKI